MANRYTELPKHKGENEVAHQLSSLGGDDMHLWFSLDSLPGVRDIDLLLIHERCGCFVIEVKAVPLKAIEEFSFDRCKIEGRKAGLSPQAQAYEAAMTLWNFLKPQRCSVFTVATACFPRIKRTDWNRAFKGSSFSGDFADRLLFEDDLYGALPALESRLKQIYQNPPVRSGANRPFRYKPELVKSLKRLLSPEARPKITPNDLSRLRAIESNIAKSTIQEAPPASGQRVIFKGRPGTGKTFRLLQIGLHHAYSGQHVLFVCFNKTLATDIRRLTSYSDKFSHVQENFEILDVFQLAVRYLDDLNVTTGDGNFDEWGELVVSELKENSKADIRLFDTVLIDEAQDMKEWQLELIELNARNDATTCIAWGTGQELYFSGARPDGFMQSFEKGARIRNLRRNFRNTRPMYEFAYCFYETNFNTVKVNALAQQIKTRRNKEVEQLEFMRQAGELPELVYIDESSLPPPSDSFYGIEQQALMVAEYRRLIERELERLGDQGYPLDLLVLIPSGKQFEHNWAVEALRQLDGDIQHVDYADPKNRRQIPSENMIRLCTFHSSRGLEGLRVLLFGFEFVERMAENRDINAANLGYVTLSRGLFDTTVAVRSTVSNATIEYLQNIRIALND